MSMDKRMIYAIIGAVILLLVGVLVYAKTNMYTTTGIVSNMTWKRVIAVQQFKALDEDTLQSQMPTDAYNVGFYTRSVPYQYLCGENCHESCYGSGKSRRCYQSCSPQYCTAIRIEDWARYTINRWTYDHDLTSTGSPIQDRAWPDFTPSATEELGAVREDGRSETFYVVFKTKDAKLFTLTPGTFEVWSAYAIGRKYTFDVSRSEEPQWATIKFADTR